MGRYQRSENQLFRADFLRLLTDRFPNANAEKLRKLGVLELIERATAADLLTDAQLRESLPKRTNTVKGYLRTFVKNEALLARIDVYVQSWSRMFCHGSYLLNLRAMDLFGGRLGDEGPVERLVPAPPDDLVQGFFNLLQRDACKHAFLPDAWAVAEDDEEVGDDAEEDEGDDDAEDDEEVGDDDAGPSAPPVAVPVVAAVSFATLDPDIQQTVERHAADLAHLVPPDWRTVLSGTAKWKCNALNFMKQQYDVAVKNHVLIHLKTRVVAYLLALAGLTADAEYPVKGIMKFPLRPYIMDQTVFEVAMHVRAMFIDAQALPPDPAHPTPYSMYVPDRPFELTAEFLGIHVFLARQPVNKSFSYLPVCDLNRKHAYVDTTIALVLLTKAMKDDLLRTETDEWKLRQTAHLTPRMTTWDAANPAVGTKREVTAWNKLRKAHVDARPAGVDPKQAKTEFEATHAGFVARKQRSLVRAAARRALVAAYKRVDPKPRSADLAFDRLIGVDRAGFKAAKKVARRLHRRILRRKLGEANRYRPASPAVDPQRRRKLRAKYLAAVRAGHGDLPKDYEITSMMTDGVAVELIMTKPCVDPAEFADRCKANAADIIARLEVKNKKPTEPTPAEMQRDYPDAQFASEDRGRAKLSAGVWAPDRLTRPTTGVVFTRNAFYNEIRHKERTRQELARRDALDLTAVYTQLGDGGGQKTTCEAMWTRYLAVQRANAPLLLQTAVADQYTARQRMLAFRLGRSCRDRFARKLLSQGDMSRPLVLGTGNASFKCTGKGEMAVPTTDLDKAVVRQLLRMKSQRKILRLFIDEFRTTVCDSETLRPTQGKQVNKWEKDEEGNVVINGRRPSHRVRVCINDTDAVGQDRDVQAARNMILLTIYKYYGIARPWQLSRGTSYADLVAWAHQPF